MKSWYLVRAVEDGDRFHYDLYVNNGGNYHWIRLCKSAKDINVNIGINCLGYDKMLLELEVNEAIILDKEFLKKINGGKLYGSDLKHSYIKVLGRGDNVVKELKEWELMKDIIK